MSNDPFTLTAEQLAVFDARAEEMCVELFEATALAFGWVANREFRTLTRDLFLSAFRTALREQYQRGFHDGYMQRDIGAQAQQGAWMGALLEGALKVSPKADSAPPESAYDLGWQAYREGKELQEPFAYSFTHAADEQQFRHGWHTAAAEAREAAEVLGADGELRRGEQP